MSQQGYPYPNFTPPSNVAQPNGGGGGGTTGNSTTTSQASFALQQLQLLQQQLQQSQQGNQSSNYYPHQGQGANSYPSQYQQPPQQSYNNNNNNQYHVFNPQQQQNGYQSYQPFPVQQQPQQSNSMYPVRVADTQTTRVPYKPIGNNNNFNRNNGGKFKPNKRPRKCYNCKGYGHVSAECPAKRIESELNYRRINHRPDYANGFGGNAEKTKMNHLILMPAMFAVRGNTGLPNVQTEKMKRDVSFVIHWVIRLQIVHKDILIMMV
ncbi:unnamed protein product [Ambrosiozyma monospora]|uniref:Unnamed protein product n=1 Tax=Ambrosiozyma monospora TaxID=43982 RepID=A0ACB5U9K0_AMBMO|nr:unnamed protein product [Ambrosiozyma monospora]